MTKESALNLKAGCKAYQFDEKEIQAICNALEIKKDEILGLQRTMESHLEREMAEKLEALYTYLNNLQYDIERNDHTL
jgi:SMC interacting uncharacterized protein involved in chromosome segregation